MNALRRHSVATAHIAPLVCLYAPGLDEYAFMCGLLHDVGAAMGILALAESFGGRVPSPGETESVLGAVLAVHERCADVIARAWNLPGEVGWVLAHHHGLETGTTMRRSTATICIAEALASELGAPIGDEIQVVGVLQAQEALGLDHHAYAELRKSAAGTLARIGEL
jgi:HD-like signal output (HDOD) protein